MLEISARSFYAAERNCARRFPSAAALYEDIGRRPPTNSAKKQNAVFCQVELKSIATTTEKRRCDLQNAHGSRALEANDMKFSRAGEVAFIRPLHETSTSRQLTQEIAFDCGHRPSHEKEDCVMTNFGLIGAAAIALLAATPAMAVQVRHHHRYAYARRVAPVQDSATILAWTG